jgi:hypothetical protein
MIIAWNGQLGHSANIRRGSHTGDRPMRIFTAGEPVVLVFALFDQKC